MMTTDKMMTSEQIRQATDDQLATEAKWLGHWCRMVKYSMAGGYRVAFGRVLDEIERRGWQTMTRETLAGVYAAIMMARSILDDLATATKYQRAYDAILDEFYYRNNATAIK